MPQRLDLLVQLSALAIKGRTLPGRRRGRWHGARRSPPAAAGPAPCTRARRRAHAATRMCCCWERGARCCTAPAAGVLRRCCDSDTTRHVKPRAMGERACAMRTVVAAATLHSEHC